MSEPTNYAMVAAEAFLLSLLCIAILGNAAFTRLAVWFIYLPAVIAASIALLCGVPLWRNKPFGDAFDIMFLVAISNAIRFRLFARVMLS